MAAPPTAPARAPKPTLSKADRRAQQEAQRAAKGQKPSGGSAKPAASPAPASAASSRPTGGVTAPSASTSRSSTQPATGAAASTSTAAGSASTSASQAAVPTDIFRRFFHHLDAGEGGRSSKQRQDAIHPAVARLALLYAEYRIVGANARCIALVETFKEVIRSYSVPSGNSLSRHLQTYLSPQIAHLVQARSPMAVSMGNAIRYLKWEIAQSPPELDDEEAKALLCEKLDHFVRDRIVLAGEVIVAHAAAKIHDGDVVLTFARSSVVEAVLLGAHAQGKRFRVVAVDSRPMLEGRNLLRSLQSAGVPTTYALLGSVGAVVQSQGVTLCMLGAHSVLADGAMYSRAGTAAVAMMAKAAGIPVVCCCETYKFSERVMLDSIVGNEMGSSPSLLPPSEVVSPLYAAPAKPKAGQPAAATAAQPTVINLLYDVSRPSDVTAVISEAGTIPPQSIPSVLREFKPLANDA